MSTTTAAVVMIVVVLIVGGAGYFGLSAAGAGGGKTTTTHKTCSPPNSPLCAPVGQTDVSTFTPYRPALGQDYVQISQGQSLPVTVQVTGGETVNEYSVNWGNGVYTNGSTPTMAYTYSTLGTYVVSAQARVGTIWHTGPHALIAVKVGPSLETSSSGFFPVLTTTITNGSGAGANYGWIQVGQGPITVTGSYASLPLNPSYLALQPSITGTGCTGTSTASSASATCSYTAAGIYTITFAGPINDTATAPASIIYQNYTWTVVVTPAGQAPGCSSCAGVPLGTSPHPGRLDIYEIAPGGETTSDPSVDYESVGAEPELNVMETLITYNGTDIGTNYSAFVPVLSTCVPGSPQCAAMYSGNNLVVNNATTGTPQYYTFPIDPNAKFYDPATHNSWPVFPSDVAFSVARNVAMATNPSDPGWILGQALLPADGNLSWDVVNGIPLHVLFYGTNSNNTVTHIMSSILVNDSTYCPASALAAHGCITFDAFGAGHSVAYFLELVAAAWGLEVQSCGWASAQGASIPGFVTPAAASGDGPCLLPGGASSTSQASFQSWLSSTPATYWDSVTYNSYVNWPVPYPGLLSAMVGSGPYYLASVSNSVGYTLAANPGYHGPTCAGQSGCYPAAGAYVPKVNVFWEPDDTIPLQEYLAGQSDASQYEAPETGEILQLAKNGQIGLYTQNTLDINQIEVNFQTNVTLLNTFVPTHVNIPADFFAQVGLRQFLVHAFPYSYYINTIDTVNGVQYALPYGGVIPRGMGDYYPTNISWPAGNPVTNAGVVGSAAWWWQQATTSGTPTYDPELAACTTSSPCVFPILGQQGASDLHAAFQAYAGNISALTGGRLQPYVYDITFANAVLYSGAPAGKNPLPFFRLGWAPDYPDPSDYVGPYLYPDSIYTSSNALYEALSGLYAGSAGNPGGPNDPYNSTSCGHWLDVGYWSAQTVIANNCQYTAYETMTHALDLAAAAVGAQRVLDFNMAEHILNGLAFYVYTTQNAGVGTYANWINPATINTNIVIGATDQLWFQWGGNGVL